MNTLLKNKRYILVAVIVSVLIILLIGLCTPLQVKAVQKNTSRKTATSVLIEKGDSLWSIASEYYTCECGSMSDYIDEIKRTNGMKSDAIFEGCYIIIPYYKK